TRQSVVLTVWEVFVTQVGGYVTARLIMAFWSATAHSIFMVAIGMDYWLALGLWVGVISQFVPTSGPYIAIVLTAHVRLNRDQPVDGVLTVAFATGYQQFETSSSTRGSARARSTCTPVSRSRRCCSAPSCSASPAVCSPSPSRPPSR